ncbi:MAG: hypothetical protein ABJC89_08975 [Acidobacteriota bacterium]
MMQFRIVIVALTFALGIPLSGAAGQGRGRAGNAVPPAAAADPAGAEALSPGQVVAMLDAYAVVQAQDSLELNDSQYGQFVTRLRKVQEVRRRNQQLHNQIVQDLRRLAGVQSTVTFDEGAVRERLKALRDQDDRSAVELSRAYEAVDEILDVRQQARFRIFEEMIERRKLDLLMRARQTAAGRRKSGPGE